jgi:hypothetical protein
MQEELLNENAVSVEKVDENFINYQKLICG